MNPDIAYANADFIENAAAYPPRWAREAQAFRAGLGARARLDLAYGVGARQRLDLFMPQGAPRGLVMFVHGGYWRMFDKDSWSHLAAGPLAHDLAVAMPSYTLAPEARIGDITREIAAALAFGAKQVGGPIMLAGHSAGGHLVARMNCADVALPDGVTARLTRIVAISPLSDLRPLMATKMNADLRLDQGEAAAESPLLHDKRRHVATIAWVGAQERPAFLDQARWLAEAWDEAGLRIAPGHHHFDVIDQMTGPDTALTRALLGVEQSAKAFRD